ncbi:hypothetical protein FOA43_001200 [Brettanomyces nanus]|uniref:Bacterial surface antigen (D15) domain-containing protein n=1 Tax=Eeniella nana TaxID=13502 RepID=A0A875S0N2_EENNA|nr:uncharacterized protein FOA43_001200 [Brettanomyces nanus]QPG73885.1 hypothetical protein FOA43_001200 [Brettanomyces nanus]
MTLTQDQDTFQTISGDVMSANSSHAVNLTKVEITGAQGFSDEFLGSALGPLLITSDLTVGQLVKQAQLSTSYFSGTECFKNVGFLIEKDSDYDRTVKSILKEEVPLNLKARLNLEPCALKQFQIGSFHESQLGNIVSLNYTDRSVLGNASYIKLCAVLNRLQDQNAQSFRATLKTPMSNSTVKLFGSASFANRSFPAFQSDRQLSTGAKVGFLKSYFSNASDLQGNISGGLSVVKRSILDVADSANDEIKTYAGECFKQSLFFNVNAGKLSYLPSSRGAFAMHGFKSSMRSEISGYVPQEGGATTVASSLQDKFHKVEFSSKFFQSLYNPNITFGCELNAGNLTILSPESDTIHFQDKFYLPLVGYKTLGLDRNSSNLGGLSYLSYKLSIYSRFFFAKPISPLRAYVSFTGAKLSRSYNDFMSSPTAGFKSTASLGMLYKVGDFAYCNVGYNWPLDDRDPESLRPGMAFSVSLYGDY